MNNSSVCEIRVGFGRANIDPVEEVPLAGYSNPEARMSNTPLTPEDHLYATCVAFSDADGSTALVCTVDLACTETAWMPVLRKTMSEASGVSEDRIDISATHTHAGPATGITTAAEGTPYYHRYIAAFAAAAKQAVDDLSPAAIRVGDIQIPDMNHVRHYRRENGHINGANFESEGAGKWLPESVTDADEQLQIIRFVREGKKDIVLLNWQAHGTASSGSTDFGRAHKPYYSADFMGYCRNRLEEQTECLVAYYSGASGNILPYHLVKKHRDFEKCPESPMDHGARLAGFILPALESLKAVESSGPVKHARVIHAAPGKVDPTPVNIELDAISVGDSIGFVTAPCEMFDTNGMFVKENSPFQITFILTCANGHHKYIPSSAPYDYSALYGGPEPYEVRVSKVCQGTGEVVAQRMVDMLRELHG